MVVGERFRELSQQADLGRHLKSQMRRKGVTVAAVAKAMGLGSSNLSQYLHGARLWGNGHTDFEAKVRQAIEDAIEEREAGVAS